MTELFAPNTADVETDDDTDLDKLFEDNVGEGKRYADPKVLFKGKYHADKHIKRLETELEEVRADLRARLSVEEALSKLTTTSRDDNQEPDRSGNPNVTALTAESIQAIIDAELNKRSQQSQIQRNQEYVVSKLKETWGDDYQSKLRQRAKELNLGTDFLSNLAQTQPDAFLAVIGTPKVTNPNQHVPPSGRTGTFPSNEKNWAYYSKLRREQPVVYHSKQTQKEMMAQAAKLGADFYN